MCPLFLNSFRLTALAPAPTRAARAFFWVLAEYVERRGKGR